MEDYIKINRETWNKKVPVHVDSEFYSNNEFIEGKSSLNKIELDLLGDVTGKSILHLQCHFGQDSLSLSRMGAEVVGVDFSDKAIDVARDLANNIDSSAKFICSDIYDLPNHLDEKFDIVFTSYGTVGWLPDINKWAGVVAQFLKPGGKFVFAEFHPVIWMFDDNFEKIAYTYFQKEDIIEHFDGTYADQSAPIQQKTITWNHGLSEVLTSLLDRGLTINSFNEFDYSPYDCFNGTIESEPGKFRIKQHGEKLPMVYSLMATKNVD